MPIEILHRFGQLLYDLRSMHILTLLLNLHLTGCWLEKYRNFQNICESQFSCSFPELFYLYLLQSYNFYLFTSFNLSLWIRSGYVLEILKNFFPILKRFFCFFALKYKANFNGYATVLYYIFRTRSSLLLNHGPKSILFLTAHAPLSSNAPHGVV